MSQFRIIRNKAPWYFLSNVLKGLSGFILLPLYTRYLNPDQYGQFQSLRSLAEFLPLIIAFSLHASFSRLYFDIKEDDKDKLACLFSTIYWFLLGWGIFIYFTSIAVAAVFIEDYLKLPLWPFIPIAFLAPVLNQISLLGDAFLRLRLESKTLSIVSTIAFFVSSLINIILLIFTDLKVEACLIGYVVISLIPFVFYSYSAFKSGILKASFKLQQLWESLKFSFPFQTAAIASWIIGYSDRLILSYYSTIALVGSYTIAVTISKVLYMVNDSITQIHGPMALEDFAKDPKRAAGNLADFLDKFMALLTIAYLGLSLFAPEMVHLFLPSSYNNSIYLIPILSAVYVVSGLYRPYVTFLSHYKMNWSQSLATVIMTVFGVIFNLILIPIWADKAAAASQLLSTIVYTVVIIYQARLVKQLNIKYTPMILPFVLAFSVSSIAIYWDITIQNFLIKVLILIGFVIFYLYRFKTLLASLLKGRADLY